MTAGPPKPYFERTSERLRSLVVDSSQADISLGELIAALRNRAIGLLLILFALPNMVPMVPGIALFVVGVGMAERDGVVIAFGLLLSIVAAVVTMAAALAAIQALLNIA